MLGEIDCCMEMVNIAASALVQGCQNLNRVIVPSRQKIGVPFDDFALWEVCDVGVDVDVQLGSVKQRI